MVLNGIMKIKKSILKSCTSSQKWAFVVGLHFTANNVMRSPNQRWGSENDCKDPYYWNGNIYFSFVNKVWILDWPRNGEMSISRFTVPFYQLLVELFSLHMNVGI